MATIAFVSLKDSQNDYEILNWYQYIIHRKLNKYIFKECDRREGYPAVWFNNKTYNKHILIAKQFLKSKLTIETNKLMIII